MQNLPFINSIKVNWKNGGSFSKRDDVGQTQFIIYLNASSFPVY